MRKTINKVILAIAMVAQLTMAILYHIGKVEHIWTACFLLSAITAAIVIVANAMSNWKQALMLSMLSCVLLTGTCKIGIVSGYVYAYTDMMLSNHKMIKTIEKSDEYEKLFSIDSNVFYVDKDYMYLYSIDKSDRGSIDAYDIVIDSDVEHYFEFDDIDSVADTGKIPMTPFFPLSSFHTGNEDESMYGVDIYSNNKINISFVLNTNEKTVILKIITEENKVFYTYVPFHENSNIVHYLQITDNMYSIGDTDIILTKQAMIVDGTDDNDEIKFKEGEQYLITANDSIYASQIKGIEYEAGTAYVDRVIGYLYEDEIKSLQECIELLGTMDEDHEDYENTLLLVNAIESSIDRCSVELVFEEDMDAAFIRMYRVVNPNMTEMYDASIIEIYSGGIYYYAGTALDFNEMH